MIFKMQEQKTAKIYIVLMKRIQEKGLNFVESEKKRQHTLLTGKLSDNKKVEIQQKINIVTAFDRSTWPKTHTEL